MSSDEDYQQFAVVLDEEDDSIILHVVGEIDIASGPDFEAAVNRAAMHGNALVVDLTECTYMDSTGLAVLARAAKRHTVSVEAVVLERSNIARVIRIVNLADLLPIRFVLTE